MSVVGPGPRARRAHLTDLGLELYDLEHAGGVLRVVVDRPGGVDLDAIAAPPG